MGFFYLGTYIEIPRYLTDMYSCKCLSELAGSAENVGSLCINICVRYGINNRADTGGLQTFQLFSNTLFCSATCSFCTDNTLIRLYQKYHIFQILLPLESNFSPSSWGAAARSVTVTGTVVRVKPPNMAVSETAIERIRFVMMTSNAILLSVTRNKDVSNCTSCTFPRPVATIPVEKGCLLICYW